MSGASGATGFYRKRCWPVLFCRLMEVHILAVKEEEQLPEAFL